MFISLNIVGIQQIIDRMKKKCTYAKQNGGDESV